MKLKYYSLQIPPAFMPRTCAPLDGGFGYRHLTPLSGDASGCSGREYGAGNYCEHKPNFIQVSLKMRYSPALGVPGRIFISLIWSSTLQGQVYNTQVGSIKTTS